MGRNTLYWYLGIVEILIIQLLYIHLRVSFYSKPLERAFNQSLGRFQKFVSFDRNWDETLLAHTYEKVDDPNDSMALQDLARRAYISVSGNCYGRVDIRKRDVSGI